MIRKDNGELIAECNECSAEFAGGAFEWSEFIQDLKDNGWKFRKEDDEWEHFCPDCVGT